MSEAIANRIHELARATRMLAVIGAALKLRSGAGVDTAIQEQIRDGVGLALGEAAGDLDDAEIAPLLVEIEMAFVESGELFREPDRTAQWKIEDHDHLQAMGRASSNAFDRILGLASTRPSLQTALDGMFLDVGTGVGGIALRAAQTCPDLAIDAIDIWEPALRLAAANVAASEYSERIQLRRLDVTELDPGPRYTLAWLPTMFMQRSVIEQAIDRIAAALRSGSWLVLSVYTRPDDPFSAVMSSLRTLRGGGEVTDPAELEALLRARGFVDIDIDVAPIATFVMGRLATLFPDDGPPALLSGRTKNRSSIWRSPVRDHPDQPVGDGTGDSDPRYESFDPTQGETA